MASRAFAAKLPPMTSDEQARAERGQRIRERIRDGGFRVVDVAAEAGVKRQTIYNAYKGEAQDSVDAIEEALTTMEDRKAHPEDYAVSKRADEPSTAERIAAGADLIEFEITGDFGVRVVARGSRADHAILAADAARIVREIRADRAQGSPSED